MRPLRNLRKIIVHCTATPPNWMRGRSNREKLEALRRMHVRDRGWDDIGYHFVIMRDGQIMEGRPIKYAGAHTKGHNHDSIGVALMGGWKSEPNDKFEQHYTAAQGKALHDLITRLKKEFPSIWEIHGHNEFAAKACPGFQVEEWLMGEPQLSSMDIRKLQELLRKMGYTEVGAVDGILGPMTRTAILAYQLDGGLRPTGVPTRGLLEQAARDVMNGYRRGIHPARRNATLKDLRRKGSRTVQVADAGQGVTAIAGTLSGLAGATAAAREITSNTTDIVAGLLRAGPALGAAVGVIACCLVGWFAFRAIKRWRLEKHRTGEDRRL